MRTELSRDELEALARGFGVGPLSAAAGLAKGSINTLYALEAGGARYVLRLSEGARTEREVRFELALLDYLAAARFPVPRVVRPGHGAFSLARGKPAVLFHFVAGEEPALADVTPARLLELGAKLGRLHRLAEGFEERLHNRYSAATLEALAAPGGPIDAHPRADAEVRAVLPTLTAEAHAWRRIPALPTGAIHADLFRDNVRFVGDRVAAILDWEMACTDAFALDLAIALNAWTFDASDRYSPALATALLAGYRSVRALTPEERDALWPLARAGAARYTASRLTDFHLADLPADKLARKDWRRYEQRLAALRCLGAHGFAELCAL